MSGEWLRILVLGAHPDDAEFAAGGLLTAHRQQGSVVRMISVTDGRSGHHAMASGELVERRRAEAARSALMIGAEASVWDFPDGYLEPTLALRRRILGEVRSFKPDLILTHRPWDYHPDHRAVGLAVQDACYLFTVPLVEPEFPALRKDPVVAFLADPFTSPAPFRPDWVLDTGPWIEQVVELLACHESQFFEWLPYHDGLLDQVPDDPEQRLIWLKSWYQEAARQRRGHFWPDGWGTPSGTVEAFEVSQYAGKVPDQELARLFPKARQRS